ncbi:MAG: Hsp20/alpha crystallin family protein [Bacteroidota bacterium]
MTLIKFRPTSTRELLRDSMISSNMMNVFDNLFNETAAKFERNVFFTPRTDVIETAQSFELHVSLPGVKKEDVKIDVDGDRLTISGERKTKEENKDEKNHLVESFYGKFSRSFNLPENVDKQNIGAALTDGILTLSIPKVEVKDNKTTVTIK